MSIMSDLAVGFWLGRLGTWLITVPSVCIVLSIKAAWLSCRRVAEFCDEYVGLCLKFYARLFLVLQFRVFCREDIGLRLCGGYLFLRKVRLWSQTPWSKCIKQIWDQFLGFCLLCVGTHFMDVVDQSLPASSLLTWSLLLFAAFVQSFGWRKEVLCQDWHSQMNSSQGMRGCTVTLLVFFTSKVQISSNGHFWNPKLNTWMMEVLLYTNLTHRYSGNQVLFIL